MDHLERKEHDKYKFSFKQRLFTTSFKDERVVKLDQDMKEVEKERLKEKQMKLKMEWKDRRAKETRRILAEAAEETLEDVLDWSIVEVGRREATMREMRG